MKPQRIIFVYNADSGFVNAMLDLVHKVVSPQTYDCSLCGLTYSPVGMRREWREFVAGLGLPATFLHRDELRARHGLDDVPLPAIFLQFDSGFRLLASAEELDSRDSMRDLMALVEERLSAADLAQQAGSGSE